MFELFSLSDKDFEYIAKGILHGVLIGIIVGAFFDNILLFFALGGVLGVIGALIYSMVSKLSRTKDIK